MSSQSEIVECLSKGYVFVTPNKRLVTFLTQRLSDEIATLQSLAEACVLPKIVSYEDFVDEAVLGQSMAGNLPLRQKIHSTAELWLWESIIRDDDSFAASAHPLLSYPALAREAQSAFRLFTEWLVDFNQYRFQFIAQLESERLDYWFDEYLRRTEQLNVCNAAQQQAALFSGHYANAISQIGETSRPENIDSTKAVRSEGQSGEEWSSSFGHSSGLCLYGFQALSPVQQACFSKLSLDQSGDTRLVYLDVNDLQQPNTHPQQSKEWLHYQAKDLEDEFRQACRWARLEQRQNPQGRFAVVVPQLVTHRSLLERLLHEEFFADDEQDSVPLGESQQNVGGASESADDQESEHTNQQEALRSSLQTRQVVSDRYNLSSGRPLGTVPMVRHWLLLLRGAKSPLTLDECAEVLLSPYFCAADIRFQRALQQAFANTRQSELKIVDWLAALDWDSARGQTEEPDSEHIASGNHDRVERCKFAVALRKLTEFLRRHRQAVSSGMKKRSIAEWIAFIEELVDLFAWPMVSTHTSDEYQQYQMFQQCLREVSNYSKLIGPLSFANAVSFVERFLNAYSYQRQTVRPETEEIPECLGVLEACGQQFDAIWLCQMSDQEWPVRNRVNALLPYALQAEEEFPGSTAREHRYAQALSYQLCGASERIVVSHCRDHDETPFRLSTYIRDEISTQSLLEYAPSEPLGQSLSLNRAEDSQGGLEVFIDDCGQVLSVGDKLLTGVASLGSALAPNDSADTPLKIRKGVTVLTDYAQLPFLAYLRHRLDISPLNAPYSGLPPLERGTLIHNVLESLWRDLTHQQQLATMPQSDIEALVDQQVCDELSRVNTRLFRSLAPAQIAIEHQAIVSLLLAWIAFEQERQAFSVIATELPVRYCYENYCVEGRVDRVDWVENTGLQLLDYKTGFSQTTGWFDESVSSPQLPLYALSLDSGSVGAGRLSEQCEKRLGDSAFVEGEQVQALAFANLRVGSLGMAGYCSEEANGNTQGTKETPAGQSSKEALGMKSIASLGDARFATWLEGRITWAASIEDCFEALLAGHADILLTADATDSPYQAILRSGFIYNGLSHIDIRVSTCNRQPVPEATLGSTDA